MTLSRISFSPPTTGRERPVYRKDCPRDRAVVACDSTGNLVVVLEFIGSGLDYLSEQESLSDAFLRDDPPPGPGIWMWEGNLRVWSPQDHELVGKYRPLSVEEAGRSMSGDSPWDPDLWYEKVRT